MCLAHNAAGPRGYPGSGSQPVTVLVSEGCATAGAVIQMQLGSMMIFMAHVSTEAGVTGTIFC